MIKPRSNFYKIFVKYGLFLATLVSIITFWQSPLAIYLLLFVISILMLAVDDFRLIKTYFGVAIFGSASEMIVISSSGAWVYMTNNIYGIPYWTFMMWGIAGVCFVSLSSFFNEVRLK